MKTDPGKQLILWPKYLLEFMFLYPDESNFSRLMANVVTLIIIGITFFGQVIYVIKEADEFVETVFASFTAASTFEVGRAKFNCNSLLSVYSR